MIIREMFAENINRPINGVIKVDQDTADVIEQEVKEYVITRELKKHFISFFDFYSDAFDKPTDDIGVWISGFFGSGKSHFLKMLSYILENKQVGDQSTVEMFRKKFEDDPATFMLIDRATRGETESILFNIDIEGSINKDKTAVLRVFAKMFYTHLGFYGENLKVAMMEQYIDQLGRTEEFRRVFEEKKGKRWIDQRKAFAFNGKYIIPTLMEVLDMSEEDAKQWFKDKSAVEFSIAHLVDDIKAYVNSKPKDFRLLFMIGEVGQYVGTDTDMLLNLQSLTEKLGSECSGKVWVMCTGQEAIDEIIKVRSDEFSRIQARFKTRLSLSSSSVDEVIQKRVLKKTPEAERKLEQIYLENDSTLSNLYHFEEAKSDIKGYQGASEFAINYPFAPYQFLIMQMVFSEIRKHGNSGKHLSGGERSMLSGFQEAAQKIQEQDEYALVPFFRFYDTVHSFLDSSIRRVIERCQRAADRGAGLEPQDVDLLKLLYLLRYVNDIPTNLDNLMILMADDIRVDKTVLRSAVRASLDRLQNQNYIGTSGNTFHFLTDEEQDISRAIKETNVDTSAIVTELSKMIYSDIYTTKKFRYGRYDFDFDKMVDGVVTGNVYGGMKLRFLTAATDAADKSDLHLRAESKGQAIVLLSESSYFESLEKAMKIRWYVKGKDVAQLPQSTRDIIRSQQDEATRYEAAAMEELKTAIVKATFYVDQERLDLRGGDAKSRIDQALEYLVEHVYSNLGLIGVYAESDNDIVEILKAGNTVIDGLEPNRDAVAKVEEYLIMQDQMRMPTSMFDVQQRYQNVPYGWREIDIAAVVAQLIAQQKVTIRYGGATIQPDNPRLPDLLRKRSEIGKTSISKRHAPSLVKMKQVRALLREYFDVMDVPSDEDGLVAFIVRRFEEQKAHYEALNQRYDGTRLYPDRPKVQAAIALMSTILSQQKDNIALIDRVLKEEDALIECKDALEDVETFFRSQVQVFDAAAKMEEDYRTELEYLAQVPEANDALNKIRMMVMVKGNFSYKKVPELNDLMAKVKKGHDHLLAEKREEVEDIVRQCMGAIYVASNGNFKVADVVDKALSYYDGKKKQIRTMKSLALLDGLIPGMLQHKDHMVQVIEDMIAPPEPPKPPKKRDDPPPPKKLIRPYNRQIIFPAKRLESEAQIDDYVEKVRAQLKQLLKNCDGIQLK